MFFTLSKFFRTQSWKLERVVLLYYQRRNSFWKRSSHWYISCANVFAWEVYYSLGIVGIFTCSLLDVNWTFRSDPPRPLSPTWDFAAPKVTAFSESLQFNFMLQHLHNLLSCWRCECRLQYSEKKTRIGNKRSPCFQRAFFMSLVHKRIYDISKLTYIWYRLTLIFFSHLGWNSKDHKMHRLLISSLLNYT